jgi:hypothetical protein
MKELGVILMVIAAIAAVVGFYNLKETEYERLAGRATDAAEDLYKFTKVGDVLVGPGQSGSAAAREGLQESRQRLEDARSERRTRSFVSFGAAAFFFLTGIICFASAPRSQVASVTAAEANTAASITQNPQALRIAHNGVDLGELPIASVRTMLSTGQLTYEDYYWDTLFQEWKPLATYPL